jgi:hypothetical protein
MIEEGPHVGGSYQGCAIHCKLCLRIFIHNMDSKAFNSARWNIDCFPRENVDLDRLNHVNFFDLCVSIPPCQPNNVDNLHVHRSPCSSHNMLFKVFKDGLKNIKIICGDGMWHIDRCPLSLIIQCFANCKKIQVLVRIKDQYNWDSN